MSGTPFYDESDMLEFCGEVIDILEDFCDDYGIEVENEERESGNGAILYGEDYDAITDVIKEMADELTEKREYCIKSIMDQFSSILKKRGTRGIDDDDKIMLKNMLDVLFDNWFMDREM